MSAKSMNLLPKPFPIPPLQVPVQNFPESKKRQLPDSEPGYLVDKKSKISMGTKRKSGKKMSASDETSSPVSGTVIRQLGAGESMPEIRKGRKHNSDSQME